MDFANLAGVVTAALPDTRWVVNPFGILDHDGRPFEAKILRLGHPDWEDFLKVIQADPEAKETQVEIVAGELARNKQRPGFRQAAKETDTESNYRVAKAIVYRKTTADKEAAAAARWEAAVSRILFRGGRHLDDQDGTVDLADADKRLELLQYARNKDGRAVVMSTPNLLGADGAPLAGANGPVENPWLGLAFGTAIRLWIEEESKLAQTTFTETKESAADFSESGPSGPTAIGSLETPTNAAPLQAA